MRRHNGIFYSRIAALMLILAALAVALPVLSPHAAYAQDQVIRRLSVFDLFMPRRGPRAEDSGIARPRYSPQRKVVRKAEKPRKPKARAVQPAEPEIAALEKLPDARVIVVIGDFLASGLAEGLESSFAQNAGIRVLDRSRGSSGFVRNDVVDWPKEIATIIEADKPAAIAIMLGSNDRQQMLVDGTREAIRSDAWTRAYTDRTSELAETIETLKIPFIWVGMPPFKSAKMQSDMLALNDLFKTAAQAGAGEFVDVWDGFVDESGAFISTGPDVNGQPVRLRTGDGINMTKAGKAKLAFFAEKPLRKMLGLPSQDGPALLSTPIVPGAPKAPVSIDRTEPMALNDPNLDGATELMGGALPTGVGAATKAPTTATEVAAPIGRADNFTGRPPAVSATKPPPVSVTTTLEEPLPTAAR